MIKKNLKLFGKHLRELRKAQNMSQAQLAFESNIFINQIGRIERGEINTNISYLFALAQALDIEPKELLNFKIPHRKGK